VTVPGVTVPGVTAPSVPSATESVPQTSSGAQSGSGADSNEPAPSALPTRSSPVSTVTQTSAGSSNSSSSISGAQTQRSSAAVPQGGRPRITTGGTSPARGHERRPPTSTERRVKTAQRALDPEKSEADSPPSGSQPTTSRRRTPTQRHGSAKAHRFGQRREGSAAGSAAKRAMISAPDQGSPEWLLLAAAAAAVGAAAAVAVALRHSRLEGRPAAGPAGSSQVSAPLPAELIEAPAAAGAGDDARLDEAAAAFALATNLERDQDLEGAEAAYRRADELGHPEAAFYLGGMLAEGGDFESAHAQYQRADELGHGAGAFNLGVLLEHQNDWAAAEAAYRRATERGRALAAFNLGVLLESSGDLDGAETAFRRAQQRGDGEVADAAGAALLDLRGGDQPLPWVER
jgi:TPR repeat protein